jgi:NAD(P)-dependent dehydrogenase (short-subunit alcohol dehydrogenase family)
MTVSVVTGSASGIGAAIRQRLESGGDRVIGVDIRDAEVIADLESREGRESAISALLERCEGSLDRLVVCAGLGPQVRPPSRVASVNYFGAVDLLDGLFEALQRGSDPAAVAVCSNSAQLAPLDDDPYVQALLEHDEDRARHVIDEMDNGHLAYMGSKNALGKALRRRSAAWGRAGVRINGIAPGATETPLLQGGLDHPQFGPAIRGFPVPLGRFGRPEEIAALVAYLFGADAAWIHGSIFFIDGGSDAEIRPDRF